MSPRNSLKSIVKMAKPDTEVSKKLGDLDYENSIHNISLNTNKNIANIVNAEEERTLNHWYDGFVRLFIWYPSSLDKKEKILLLKLDICILTYVCCSYFTKSLDKSNITNAYVSGMENDINFGGDDLSYAKSLYSAGYIISMCFGMLFVTRPWARYMLPVLELIWGVLTFCGAAVRNPSDMFALRFLIGLAEGPIFCSVVHILGSWYKRDEIYRRVMVFSISSSLGGMFSGYLQSAAYVHLSGKGGLGGWKWGFIIDGILTVPIALIGFFVFPGAPYQVKKLWWLCPEDIQLANERTKISGIAAPGSLNLSLIKRVFLRWHVHYFTAFWVLLNVVALTDGTAFPLWLLANSPDRFSVTQVNNYPTIQAAVGIVAQFFFAGLSDTFSIYPFLIITQCLFIISYSSLAAWNIPDGWRWVCYLIIGFDGVNQAIISGWINRSCRHDNEERAFVLGFSDAVSQAINVWTNIVFYPTSDAPNFRKGFIASLVAAILMLFLPIFGYMGDRFDRKQLQNSVENDSIASNVQEIDIISKEKE
ncbi:uncharacterized protein PRCAT00004298001 [Priceomyces carsonii]|uniref:uncharacterized protein n=1 Tax=Priceomyces carsonii TaxID=28549 RepID=UPI002EDADD5F|nr:unnamed protein product [Priceomyces carsonii]